MRLAGKRFWTWISVAALSVFVKGEGGALAQEQSSTNNPSSSTQLKHNVIPHFPKSKTKVVDKLGSSTTTGASSLENGRMKSQSGLKSASGLKTTSSIGEKRDVQVQSGLKTSSHRGGGDDTPTESATKSKHHGSKRSK